MSSQRPKAPPVPVSSSIRSGLWLGAGCLVISVVVLFAGASVGEPLRSTAIAGIVVSLAMLGVMLWNRRWLRAACHRLPTHHMLVFDLTSAGKGVVMLAAPWLMVGIVSRTIWLTAIGGVAAMLLVVDLVVGVWLVRRLEVSATASTAVELGAHRGLRVAVSGWRRVPIAIAADDLTSRRQWNLHAGITPVEGTIPWRPQQVGRFHRVLLAVRTAAPFGLIGISGLPRVALPRPVTVIPPEASLSENEHQRLWSLIEAVRAEWGSGRSAPLVSMEPAGGVRHYQAGDRRSAVHWPSSARTGELMVREPEHSRLPTVVVVVEAPNFEQRDLALGRARTVIRELHREGVTVRMVAHEWSPAAAGFFADSANGTGLDLHAMEARQCVWQRALDGHEASQAWLAASQHWLAASHQWLATASPGAMAGTSASQGAATASRQWLATDCRQMARLVDAVVDGDASVNRRLAQLAPVAGWGDITVSGPTVRVTPFRLTAAIG